jgi:hypothetical protein
MQSGSINVAANSIDSNRPETSLPSSSVGASQILGGLGPPFRSRNLYSALASRILAVQMIRNRAGKPAFGLHAKQTSSIGLLSDPHSLLRSP